MLVILWYWLKAEMLSRLFLKEFCKMSKNKILDNSLKIAQVFLEKEKKNVISNRGTKSQILGEYNQLY